MQRYKNKVPEPRVDKIDTLKKDIPKEDIPEHSSLKTKWRP